MLSDVIRCYQMLSDVIRCYQMFHVLICGLALVALVRPLCLESTHETN